MSGVLGRLLLVVPPLAVFLFRPGIPDIFAPQLFRAMFQCCCIYAVVDLALAGLDAWQKPENRKNSLLFGAVIGAVAAALFLMTAVRDTLPEEAFALLAASIVTSGIAHAVLLGRAVRWIAHFTSQLLRAYIGFQYIFFRWDVATALIGMAIAAIVTAPLLAHDIERRVVGGDPASRGRWAKGLLLLLILPPLALGYLVQVGELPWRYGVTFAYLLFLVAPILWLSRPELQEGALVISRQVTAASWLFVFMVILCAYAAPI